MREEILEQIIDMLEAEDEIAEDTALDDIFEWDSLAALSFIALGKKKHGKSISSADITQCETVKDLIDLLV